jgi:hypothetical protein
MLTHNETATMNQTHWLSRLLVIGAALEAPVGLGLLIAPSALALLLLGAPLADAGLVVARLAGGGLLALGMACWFARATPSAPAGLGVAGAFLVYNVAASVVLALARPAPTTSPLQLGAAVLHGFLAIGLSVALLGHQRRSGGS